MCGYLGTDPALFGLPTASAPPDVVSAQTELHKLQAVIRSANATGVGE
jgi:hypothetical protein